MDNREIYGKTEAGREEIRTRALQLPGALRNVLLLIDGQRTLAQLKTLMMGGKAPPDAVDQLLAKGLIELAVPVTPPPPPEPEVAPEPEPLSEPPPTSPPIVRAAPAIDTVASATRGVPAPTESQLEETQRFNRLYNVMNEITRDYLGLRGVFMQLKIEKCSSSENLLALQDELRAAIAKAHDSATASELIARIQAAA